MIQKAESILTVSVIIWVCLGSIDRANSSRLRSSPRIRCRPYYGKERGGWRQSSLNHVEAQIPNCREKKEFYIKLHYQYILILFCSEQKALGKSGRSDEWIRLRIKLYCKKKDDDRKQVLTQRRGSIGSSSLYLHIFGTLEKWARYS